MIIEKLRFVSVTPLITERHETFMENLFLKLYIQVQNNYITCLILYFAKRLYDATSDDYGYC
jgi:hypothetical protein